MTADRRDQGAMALAALGQEIPGTLLPVLLAAAERASAPLWVGLAEAAAGAGLAAGRGGITRRLGSRDADTSPLGMATAAVASALLGAITATWQAIVLRAGGTSLADIGDPAHRRGRALDGLALGRIAAPALAALLLLVVAVRTAMLLALIPGLVAAALLVVNRPAPHRHAADAAAAERGIRDRLRMLVASRGLSIAVAALECGNVAITVLVLRVISVLMPGLGSVGAGAAAAAMVALHALSATVAGAAVATPRGRRRARHLLGAAALLLIAAYLVVSTQTHAALLALSFALGGTGIGVARRAELRLLEGSVASDDHEELRAALGMVQGAGTAIASALVGVLWAAVSIHAAAIYLVAMLAAAALAVMVAPEPAAAL